MLRAAQPEDQGAIESFLASHSDTSMFLRSNIAAHGVCGGPHRHATKAYLWREDDQIVGVFGRTTGGFLMMQLPDQNDAAVQAWRETLKGVELRGFTGPAEQVRGAISRLGICGLNWQKAEDQPLYSLDMKDLVTFSDLDKTRRPNEADRPKLEGWYRHMELDTGMSADTSALKDLARARAEAAIGEDHTRLLLQDGVPVAVTSFNARLPDCVQIGGVFVPREFRRRGLARRVVSAHLQEAAGRGVRRAILFAANPHAARAYEAIGFRHIGAYRLNLLPEAITL